MKVVLFCGGQGTRMRSSANDLPKPLVPLGSRPVLWHVMKYYAHFGHTDFILCLGYKGAAIKEFFIQYQEWISNDCVLSDGGQSVELLRHDMKDWRITLVDTGIDASVGERLLAVRPFLENESMFLANYSDGLTDCALPDIVNRFQETRGVGACMVVRPNISLHFVNHASNGMVTSVQTAEQANTWINAGFFTFRREIFDYIRPGDDLIPELFERLIAAQQLVAVPYGGFWRCCDTFKDLQTLEGLLSPGPGPWELWRRFPSAQAPTSGLRSDVAPRPLAPSFARA
jgi:glucose-1-phosphate cytidylyltransferase